MVLIVATYVIVWVLHPSLLLSTSTATGGDMGAHVVSAAYLYHHLGVGLTWNTWYPGWFAGMPLYNFYFIIPDLFAAYLAHIIPFTVAFKLATAAGSLAMPWCAYAMGRLMGAPRPVPAALAAGTIPFLLDASFTIDGGNLFSSMAGEYPFSLGLSFALLSVGLASRLMRTGRGKWLTSLAMAATLLSHLLPFFFALIAIVVLYLIDWPEARSRRRGRRTPLYRLGAAAIASFGWVAWWLLPFAATQGYTNSMGYVNNSVANFYDIFQHLGWWFVTSSGSVVAGGDRVVIVLAGVALFFAFALRDRVGIFLTVMATLSLVAYIADPQSVIWNERLVPFWFLSVYLSAAWLVGRAVAWLIARLHRAVWPLLLLVGALLVARWLTGPIGLWRVWLFPTAAVVVVVIVIALSVGHVEDVASQAFAAAGVVLAILLAVVVPPLIPPVASATGVNVTGNEVANWTAYNYSGYEAKSGWGELRIVSAEMRQLAQRYGCGRAMWEYNSDQNRFGTTMALMALPYFTADCISSMEGLYFESSATTPYHFLDQAELSLSPSDPMVGLPYGGLNVTAGVRHLQMLGVRYYLAYQPSVVAAASADSQLQLVAILPTMNQVTWHIYVVRSAPLVTPLQFAPTVIAQSANRTAWLNANVAWWQNPGTWTHFLAASGPADWPRSGPRQVAVTSQRPEPHTTVSKVHDGGTDVSFDVSRLGTPIEIKISYFPNWHVSGANGPYRVSPNLMVVVPTSHHVVLSYTNTSWGWWGNVLTDITAVIALRAAWRRRWWRRPRRYKEAAMMSAISDGESDSVDTVISADSGTS
jgi:hypothetical protein